MTFGSDLDERIALLRGIWLFSTCDDDELARIAAVAEPREAEVGTIGPGGFFGEMALIDGAERVATVTATSPMQLLVLDRHDFNEMLELAMPQIAPKLLAVVGARMRAIDERTGVDATLGL
jgi:CRP-like cAMP-binding protein